MAYQTVQQRSRVQAQARVRLALRLGTAAVAILCHTQGVVAQEAMSQTEQLGQTVRSFDIPTQPLTSALITFSRQSGVQVTSPSRDTVGSIRSGSVKGSLTPQQALDALLAGTGLNYRFTSNSVAVISGQQTTGNDELSDPNSTILQTILIKGNRLNSSGSGYQGTPDWVYETPGSVSVVSREAILNAPSRNARDLLDNVAGVYADRSNGQDPGVAINIRGLQDQNRIVTMIDGARQNFQMAGHGSKQRTYVDTAFVRTIDIEKMGGAGVGGAGNLGGSVNFRTIVADDLIQDDKNWGVELNGTTGSNGFRFDGSAAGAYRFSDSFSILGGYSAKKTEAYEIGKNGTLTINPATIADTTPVFTGSEGRSSILKAEGQLSDNIDFNVGWLRTEAEFSTGYNVIAGSLAGTRKAESRSNVVNNTVTADLHWNPDSDLIDLRAKVWFNHTKFDQQYQQYFISTIEQFPVDYRLGTFGASIENTSFFDTPLGGLSWNYGVEAFRDDGKTVVKEIIDNSATQTDGAAGITGPNPTGVRNVVSAFTSAKLEHDDWLTVTGGLRYDWYQTKGTASFVGLKIIPPTYSCGPLVFQPGMGWFPDPPCSGDPFSRSEYPKYDIPVDQSDGALLPSMTVAMKPWEGVQPFVKYARTFRPPTLMEQLWGGQHHPFSSPIGYAPNENLKAEKADTYEIGVNLSQDGMLTADDRLRMKVVGFYRDVEDYIAYGLTYRPEANRTYTTFLNLDGSTRMKGVEIEANYDMGLLYAGVSATFLDTNYADGYIYNGPRTHKPNGQWLNPGERVSSDTLFSPPDLRVTADAGVRLFDQRLTLGGRVTHSSGGKSGETVAYDVEDYTIYDLYGSYAFNENAKLRFAINNVADRAYVPAMGTEDLPAPGRTFTASLNFKF